MISVVITFIFGFISIKKVNESMYVKDLIVIILVSLIPCGFVLWILIWLLFWIENSDFTNKKLF